MVSHTPSAHHAGMGAHPMLPCTRPQVRGRGSSQHHNPTHNQTPHQLTGLKTPLLQRTWSRKFGCSETRTLRRHRHQGMPRHGMACRCPLRPLLAFGRSVIGLKTASWFQSSSCIVKANLLAMPWTVGSDGIADVEQPSTQPQLAHFPPAPAASGVRLRVASCCR